MLKKLAVLLAAVAVSAPAFADRGHRDHRDHRHHYKPKHVVVHRPAVVHHYYHRPAPRPVYVVERPHYNGVALIAGAIIGAAIVHHATTTSYGY
ncbi:MAG TPA: hypothetical protein VFZ54_01465 [Burkholderiales bacterium]